MLGVVNATHSLTIRDRMRAVLFERANITETHLTVLRRLARGQGGSPLHWALFRLEQ